MSEKLEEVVAALTQAIDKPGGLTSKIEQLCGLIASLQGKTQKIEDFLGRVVFPADAMGELTAELRAVRYLLDENHKFRNMDVQRAKTGGKSVAGGAGKRAR